MTYLHRFGSERADDDYARGDTYKDVFVESAAVKDFLTRDPGYRYVLGTMGAGKSIMVIKLREHLESSQKGSLFAPSTGVRVYAPSVTFANSVRWAGFWQLEKAGQHDINAWAQLWEWALLKCILGHWVEWARHSAPQLAGDVEEALQSPTAQTDPFTCIAEFVDVTERQGPGGNPKLPQSTQMRAFVERASNSFPPTYVFLDNQDDFFQQVPEVWTASALGCKLAIDQIVRRSNHRIHLVMTLRPEMLWWARMDADAMRHQGELFPVEWSQDQMMEVFEKRAQLLRDELLRDPTLRDRNPFAAFFGQAFYTPDDTERRSPYIENHGVGRDEPIRESLKQYLYRHTLGRPREIIMLGNEIINSRRNGRIADASEQVLVRDAVARASQRIARAYLGEIKHRWPWRSRGDGSSEAAIKRFLRDYVGSNIIDRRNLEMIETTYFESCDHGVDDVNDNATPFSVLASAGLVGWLEADRQDARMVCQHFTGSGAADLRVQVPGTVKRVLIHPVLYGGEFDIRSEKGLVVGPGVKLPKSQASIYGLI